MPVNNSIWGFVAAVVLIPFAVFGVVNWYERQFSALPVNDHTEALSFKFENQQGQTVTEENIKGTISVANFFFTHCPVICPKMTANLKKVQEAFNAENIRINSFTVDPQADSVAQLQRFAKRFNVDDQNWNLLTGEKIAIYRLARKGFAVVASDGDGGPTDFIHSDRFVLLDKQQRIRGYYDGTSESEVNQLINDIKKLQHEN